MTMPRRSVLAGAGGAILSLLFASSARAKPKPKPPPAPTGGFGRTPFGTGPFGR